MRLREQWDHREGGMGLKTVAVIGLAFACGMGTMLYFVAPEVAKQTVTEAWNKVARSDLLKRGGPTTRPVEEGVAAAPTTQPVAAHPSVVMGGEGAKVVPTSAVPAPAKVVPPAPPPRPKAVLVMNGAKGKKEGTPQGWTTGTGGKQSLVMEGPKPKAATRPTADGKPQGAVAAKGTTKSADPRVATAYAGKGEAQRRVEKSIEGRERGR